MASKVRQPSRNKKDMARRISDENKIHINDVSFVLNQFILDFIEDIQQGYRINLHEIGVFYLVDKEQGDLPLTVAYRPSKELLEKINSGRRL